MRLALDWKKGLAAALMIGLLGAGFALAKERDDKTPLVDQGWGLAGKNCSPCHAIGLAGDSPNPKSPPFRTLGQRYPLKDLEEALAEGIVVGHEGVEMPEFQLNPRQIEALLAYLQSIQRRP